MNIDLATTDGIFSSSAGDMFTKINHVLAHKTSIATKEVKIIQSVFSDHSGVKLEINFKNI